MQKLFDFDLDSAPTSVGGLVSISIAAFLPCRWLRTEIVRPEGQAPSCWACRTAGGRKCCGGRGHGQHPSAMQQPQKPCEVVARQPRVRRLRLLRRFAALPELSEYCDLDWLSRRRTDPRRRRAVRVEAWKDDYNMVRPHSALGNLSPAEYVDRGACPPQRDGALRYTGGSAPRPGAPPSPMGSNETGTLLIGG
jgi:hypothetical protein